jgi:hypothetical protein
MKIDRTGSGRASKVAVADAAYKRRRARSEGREGARKAPSGSEIFFLA